jgi:hypothetical protein
MRYSMSPLRDRNGAPVGVVQFVTDATAEAEAARSRVLAEVSGAVSGAPDAAGALRVLTDALVLKAADLAAIYVFPAAQSLAPSGRAIPPLVMTISEGLKHAGPPPATGDWDRKSRWRAALAAGSAVFIAVDQLVLGSHPAASWLVEVRANNFAVTPLVLAGEVAGNVLLVSPGSRPPMATPIRNCSKR